MTRLASIALALAVLLTAALDVQARARRARVVQKITIVNAAPLATVVKVKVR